ncbi:MAG: hypothetical protein ACTSSP_00905 [Candidatus Asgardarchaeia archaeon]
MRIINTALSIASFVEGTNFDELYDFFGDDTISDYKNYMSKDVDAIDYDALERGEVPVVEIGDENVGEYLADNFEEAPVVEEPYEEPEITDERLPEFGSTEEAMKWAIDNNKVVRINYITQGRTKSRGGRKLKREIGLGTGASITRIIEPHYMYPAKNGNLILVTFDRSVRHIRAFIVPNIVNYIFPGKEFRERMRVMPQSGKGIKAMIINKELDFAIDKLQKNGMKKSAEVVKDAHRALANLKIAQYVGVQGYWLRNRRCWDNCYRSKRTTKPETPAQEVWMECWEEYKNSINNDKSGWEKYATKEKKKIKLSEKEEKGWNKLFITKIEGRVKEGLTTPQAIYATIEEESKKHTDLIVESSANLTNLAESLKENGYTELGDKLADISIGLLKEAGLWDTVKDVGKGISNWVGNLVARKGTLIKKLQNLANRANRLVNLIQKNVRSTRQVQTAQVTNDLQRNVYTEYQDIVSEAGEMLTWMGGLISQENPRTQQILQPAISNLQEVVNQSNAAWGQGGITYQGIYDNAVKVLNGVNMAMNSVYNIPDSDRPSVDMGGEGQVSAPAEAGEFGQDSAQSLQSTPEESIAKYKLTGDKTADLELLVADPEMYKYLSTLVNTIRGRGQGAGISKYK